MVGDAARAGGLVSRTHGLAFADAAARGGYTFAMPHFRGRSRELNLAPPAYHLGEYEEALDKLRQHPGLFDEQRLRTATTLYEFGEVFTLLLHGFKGSDDHLARA